MKRDPKLRAYWPECLLFMAAIVAMLWRLGRGSLWDWDEAIYAQVAWELVQSGDWMTLHWSYEPWFEKPPLFMWTTALFYHLFGVDEFWSRAASAISGITLTVITYETARYVYGRQAGLLSVAVLLSTHGFVFYSRFGTTDIMLSTLTLAAVYCYVRVTNDNPRWWFGVWLSVALAVMVKSAAGLIGIIAIGLTATLNREITKTLTSWHFKLGLLIALLIVAPWHLYMYLLHGEPFLDVYLGKHVVQRTFTALEGNEGGPFYYLTQLREQFFPWCYLAPFAMASVLWRERIEARRNDILWVFVIVVVAVITLVETKLPWYIVPAYPALAIMIGITIKRAVRPGHSMVFAALAVASLLTAFAAPAVILLSFVGLAAITVAYCWRMGKDVFRPAAVLMVLFLVLVGTVNIAPLYEQKESPIARLAQGDASSGEDDRDPIVVFADIEGRWYRSTVIARTYGSGTRRLCARPALRDRSNASCLGAGTCRVYRISMMPKY